MESCRIEVVDVDVDVDFRAPLSSVISSPFNVDTSPFHSFDDTSENKLDLKSLQYPHHQDGFSSLHLLQDHQGFVLYLLLSLLKLPRIRIHRRCRRRNDRISSFPNTSDRIDRVHSSVLEDWLAMNRRHPVLQDLWKREGLCIPRHPALESRTRCTSSPQVAISLSSTTPIGVCSALWKNRANRCQLLIMYNSSSSPNSTAQNSRIFRMSIWLRLWYVYPLQEKPRSMEAKESRQDRGFIYILRVQNADLGGLPRIRALRFTNEPSKCSLSQRKSP